MIRRVAFWVVALTALFALQFADCFTHMSADQRATCGFTRPFENRITPMGSLSALLRARNTSSVLLCRQLISRVVANLPHAIGAHLSPSHTRATISLR